MATAMAVLAAGAIPVIVDIDETITIDPDAVDDTVGPRTRAVIPVHMWGAACAMDRIMEVAARHDLGPGGYVPGHRRWLRGQNVGHDRPRRRVQLQL